MILTNKKENELIISCKCGCGDGLHLRIEQCPFDESYAIMSYINSNFYRDQNGAFRTLLMKIKKIWCIIRNKDYHYSDTILSKDEFQELKDYICKH